ncbi:hypothetical protein [Streptomyces sp. SID3343]|uniref:hypothetical protein n=1 Tax=Streptomyces sp. SID3343 TaxID=2690260 RepID=UPI00136893F3|nr:hypothetical protein [Streptomyces sp. SID3343]MYV99599.1 hypothetical protein [Streptomyces sp. SID3343]
MSILDSLGIATGVFGSEQGGSPPGPDVATCRVQALAKVASLRIRVRTSTGVSIGVVTSTERLG